MKVGDYYALMKEKLLAIYSSGEAETICHWTFEHFLGLSKMEIRLNAAKDLTAEQYNQLSGALKALLQHQPVQYVLGEAWFLGMKFIVDESVLIPRPETEELVAEIINKECGIKNEELRITNYELRDYENKSAPFNIQHSTFNILDIGTGSGCIPISLKKKMPDAAITSIDISSQALSIAQQNATHLNTEINFIELDFLDENNWTQLDNYNIIVSNPPYIPINEKALLDKNVTDWEPSLALFVGDNDPLIFYRKIALFAKTHLNKNGQIFLEIHQDYAAQTKALFDEQGFTTVLKKDINGNDRMMKASYKL